MSDLASLWSRRRRRPWRTDRRPTDGLWQYPRCERNSARSWPSLTTEASRSQASQRQVRVIFIGGQGRSGTTLMERALGELDGVVSVGETVHLGTAAFATTSSVDAVNHSSMCFLEPSRQRRVRGLGPTGRRHCRRSAVPVDRNRYLPMLMRTQASSSTYRGQQALRRACLGSTGRREVSGAASSSTQQTRVLRPAALGAMPSIDLRLLHVVRDSRAVAHAWTKTVARPEAGGHRCRSTAPRRPPCSGTSRTL